MTNIQTNIKLFYFPLNVLIVDDDQDFLNLIHSKCNKMENISIFNSPIDAMNKLNPIKIDTKYFIDNLFNGVLDINYNNIKQFLDSCETKDGIIIADYDMPHTNGIQLLNKYKNYDIIKILLTNIYSPAEAVNALHDDIIDYYMPKDQLENISSTIEKLQHKYFDILSDNILDLVNKNNYKVLFDQNFITIFNETCEKFKINKYYILNSYGHYYLANDTEQYILTIYNSSNLQEIANDTAQDKVINGDFIPSYFSEDDDHISLISANKFENYSYCVEKIKSS